MLTGTYKYSFTRLTPSATVCRTWAGGSGCIFLGRKLVCGLKAAYVGWRMPNYVDAVCYRDRRRRRNGISHEKLDTPAYAVSAYLYHQLREGVPGKAEKWCSQPNAFVHFYPTIVASSAAGKHLSNKTPGSTRGQ